MGYTTGMNDSPAVIEKSEELVQFCEIISRQPYVAVDTEFMRQKTYRPILCLIQMAAPGVEGVIDPLAPGLNLEPFYQLMANAAVTKVFHAARQDVEIIVQEAKVIPLPLFDTQIAAMALGYGEAVSYGMLVKKLLKLNHDKTYQAIDWAARPLKPQQLDYALGDVTHLRELYVILQQRLRETGREGWLKEEVALLTDPRTYAFDPAEAWKRMKLGGKTKQARHVIAALSAWRERVAQEENVPRGRVIKDDAIYEIAKYVPRSLEALGRLRAVKDIYRQRGEAIMAAINGALAGTAPQPHLDGAVRDMPASAAATVELLRVLLRAVAADLNIAPKLIASSEELEQLALSDDADIQVLKGWRREMFGEKAIQLKKGGLALRLKNNEIEFIKL
jgi:ribonuclease D